MMRWLGTGIDRNGKLAWLVCLLLLIVAPFVGVYPIFVMTVQCFTIFAMALNQLLGYTGLLSFGHAAFFGGAAYDTGWLVHDQHWTPKLGLIAGTLAAGFAGLIVGLRRDPPPGHLHRDDHAGADAPLRPRGASFTGGEDGIQGIQRGKLFGFVSLDNDIALYSFVLVVFVAALLFVLRVVHSPYGQVHNAIRENEPRAVWLAGLAGGLKALVLHLATLQDGRWEQSGEVILMKLLGGLGTFAGPVVGRPLLSSACRTCSPTASARGPG